MAKRKFSPIFNIFQKIKTWDDLINSYKNKGENSIPTYAYLSWGIQLAELGLTEEALKKFEQSASMAHRNPDAHINIGIIKAKEGKLEEALEDSSNLKAHIYLACGYLELGNKPHADRMLKKAIKIESRNPKIYTSYAVVLAKIGEKEEALKYFEKAYSLNPANMRVLYMWAMLLLELGNFEEALLRLNILKQIEPFWENLSKLLAICHNNLGNSKEAIEFSQKALGEDPMNVECHIILAQNLAKPETKEQCLNHIKKQKTLEFLQKLFTILGVNLCNFLTNGKNQLRNLIKP